MRGVVHFGSKIIREKKRRMRGDEIIAIGNRSKCGTPLSKSFGVVVRRCFIKITVGKLLKRLTGKYLQWSSALAWNLKKNTIACIFQ